MKPLLRHALPLLGLVALPCLANLLLILGIRHADPALFYQGLAIGLRTGPFPAPGSPTWADPTIGLITQAQGILSAKDWLAGIVPWWNPYTGVGMPLAAEMQTLSFFLPFVLLLRFAHGWLVLRLVLQSLSGAALYALLLDLGATRFAAFVAGGLYGLSGTFFLVPHAAGPLVFMPLLLLGVERANWAALAGTRHGWGITGLAIAAMIYAGYPETAYFGGLLGALWSLRLLVLAGPARFRLILKLAAGLGLGLALAAPLLIPFADYVRVSYYGPHDWLFALLSLPASALLSFLPFAVGPIAGPVPQGLAAEAAGPINSALSQTGTWFGVIALAIGLSALSGRHRHRGLVLMLGVTIVVGMARVAGFGMARTLFNLIPFVGTTDAIRFVTPALDLALLIMVGLAVDRWQRTGPMPRRDAVLACVALIALVGAVALPYRANLAAWYAASRFDRWFALSVCGAQFIAAVCVLLLLTKAPNRRTLGILAAITLGDAVATMASGQAAAALNHKQAAGGIGFLRQHQGLGRMFTLGPYGPNYPAADRIASINTNQLPVAANWIAYGNTALGLSTPDPLATAAASLRNHGAAFRAIGVDTVLAPPGFNPFITSTTLKLDPAANGVTLAGEASLTGTLPASLIGLHTITNIGVDVGTFDGASTGVLKVLLCARNLCARGHATLDHAGDNAMLSITLDHALTISPTTKLAYQFSHKTGKPVVLWTGRIGATGPIVPRLSFSALPRGRFSATLMYQDRAMRIYHLPGAAPFYQAAGCTLSGAALNRVTADCAEPARLVRLEAWFGGWHAAVNGRPVRIGHDGALFQSILLPAGLNRVRFFYRPRHTRLACALALAALALAAVLRLGALRRPRL